MKHKKESIISEILRDDNHRECAKRIAVDNSLDFGLVWRWVLDELKTKAKKSITLDRVSNCINNIDDLNELLTELNQDDESLSKVHLFESYLKEIDFPPDFYKMIVYDLPRDGSKDSYLDEVIFRSDFPLKLLHELIEQNRFIVEIAHRAGPEEILLKVVDKYSGFEPVFTLIGKYYSKPEVSLERYSEFLNLHKNKHGEFILKFIKQSDSVSDDRKTIAESILNKTS